MLRRPELLAHLRRGQPLVIPGGRRVLLIGKQLFKGGLHLGRAGKPNNELDLARVRKGSAVVGRSRPAHGVSGKYGARGQAGRIGNAILLGCNGALLLGKRRWQNTGAQAGDKTKSTEGRAKRMDSHEVPERYRLRLQLASE